MPGPYPLWPRSSARSGRANSAAAPRLASADHPYWDFPTREAILPALACEASSDDFGCLQAAAPSATALYEAMLSRYPRLGQPGNALGSIRARAASG